MKSDLLDLSENFSSNLKLDTAISFRPFLECLKKRAREEKTLKADFYQQVLTQFDHHHPSQSEIALEEIQEYEILPELMYSCLSPTMDDSTKIMQGLCVPFSPFLFYGTDHLYQLLNNDGHRKGQRNFFPKEPKTHHKENLQQIYSFILKRLYGFSGTTPKDGYFVCAGPQGIDKHYELHIDTRFVDVHTKGALPDLDLKKLFFQLNEGAGYDFLENTLALSNFKFSGISIITVKDVTAQYALDNIKSSWIYHTAENEVANYNKLIHYLKMLVNDSRIEFELFPFFRVNNKMVYAYDKGGSSLLTSVWGEKRLSPDRFSHEAEGYSSNARSYFSKNIKEEADDENLLHLFRPYNVCSLALKPVFLNEKALGVLGIYTHGDDMFDENTLAIVEDAMPALAQLLQVYIDEFNLEIENIVKDKFTSIQTSVQWKFNEVAWHYLYDKKKGISATEIEPVFFDNVHPLYGAVDIRNSSLQRNIAIKADLQNQLTLLSESFAQIKEHAHSPLLDEMIFKCKKWLDMIHSKKDLLANEETHLNNFLTYESIPFLDHLQETAPGTRSIIKQYLKAIDETEGEAFRNKRVFELSMQMINSGINHYLESKKREIQTSFPCYFEKFKTDGVEYDIYIGQSIAPDKSFNNFHIRNLRLWQLKSMAEMAKITHSLLPQMPIALQTTQLLFAHGKTIAISFRNDERRFDVEGDYNIRYQMIKKRIDKVKIKNVNERLTQPGKIALVYLNRQDVEDYREHIFYLQEMKILKQGLEEHDLEDLQGISGLKALRVAVNLDDQ